MGGSLIHVVCGASAANSFAILNSSFEHRVAVRHRHVLVYVLKDVNMALLGGVEHRRFDALGSFQSPILAMSPSGSVWRWQCFVPPPLAFLREVQEDVAECLLHVLSDLGFGRGPGIWVVGLGEANGVSRVVQGHMTACLVTSVSDRGRAELRSAGVEPG